VNISANILNLVIFSDLVNFFVNLVIFAESLWQHWPCSWWCKRLNLSRICGTKPDMVFQAIYVFFVFQKQKSGMVV